MKWQRNIYKWSVLGAYLILSCSTTPEPDFTGGELEYGPTIRVWKTTPDRSLTFSESSSIQFVKTSTTAAAIVVDTVSQYQVMDGFGFALTGGSAQLINTKLSPTARTGLLTELFSSDGNGIGISYLRISIGASDLDDHVFSYDDMPQGETDVMLENFSIDEDRVNLIPVLKEILAINPDIKILGSPWSAPAWMKTNENVKGGSLKPEYYAVYANYFVKYLKAMEDEGISLDAVTLQNEPEHPGNTPSMTMTAEEQNDFIKNHVGPAFANAGITTKIFIFDHNCNNPDYPLTILNDPVTRNIVDGTAFHLYLGSITALSTVHNQYPDKNLYFTEQWTSGEGNFEFDLRWHMRNVIVGAPRNWSKNVIEWNLASDENWDPHTDGGCTTCQGAITINSVTGGVGRNLSYFLIAHASKLVRPGSVHVASNIIDNIHNVAYLTPDGKKVLIAINDNDEEKTVPIVFRNMTAVTKLCAGCAATYYW